METKTVLITAVSAVILLLTVPSLLLAFMPIGPMRQAPVIVETGDGVYIFTKNYTIVGYGPPEPTGQGDVYIKSPIYDLRPVVVYVDDAGNIRSTLSPIEISSGGFDRDEPATVDRVNKNLIHVVVGTKYYQLRASQGTVTVEAEEQIGTDVSGYCSIFASSTNNIYVITGGTANRIYKREAPNSWRRIFYDTYFEVNYPRLMEVAGKIYFVAMRDDGNVYVYNLDKQIVYEAGQSTHARLPVVRSATTNYFTIVKDAGTNRYSVSLHGYPGGSMAELRDLAYLSVGLVLKDEKPLIVYQLGSSRKSGLFYYWFDGVGKEIGKMLIEEESKVYSDGTKDYYAPYLYGLWYRQGKLVLLLHYKMNSYLYIYDIGTSQSSTPSLGAIEVPPPEDEPSPIENVSQYVPYGIQTFWTDFQAFITVGWAVIVITVGFHEDEDWLKILGAVLICVGCILLVQTYII